MAGDGVADARDVSLEQALAAQRRLREALGLPEERFAMPAFIGMISDEIEQMRAAGRSDAETAAMVGAAAGFSIDEEELRRFYAPAEARGRA